MKIKTKKTKKIVKIQIIQKEKTMKTHAMRINKMFLTSLLIVSLGYTSTLTLTTNVEVDALTIGASDKIIVNTGVVMTVTGAVSITGTLQMDGTAIVNSGGAVTVESAGVLDMNGTSRLKVDENLTFNSGTLQAEDGTGIDLFKGGAQTLTGTIVGNFKSITRRGGVTVWDFNSVTIEDSLDTGGGNFTLNAGKTLIIDDGCVVEVSGGAWTPNGTLTLHANSKFLYTGSAETMQPVMYGNIEHAGGTLTQKAGGTLSLAGTFTNTSGNFAASEAISAVGIVWTSGQVTLSPAEAWDIGTGGITINGGTFVGTTGAFTVEGDWTLNTGTFTHGNSTVDFDGAGAQEITSGASDFFNVSISNVGDIVDLGDAFTFAGAALTIDAGAKFALSGYGFTAPAAVGRIVNNGIFILDGDETTTAGLDIPGDTKFVAPSNLTITNTLGALDDVTFDASGSTLTFSETIAYISGDIIVQTGTTINMATHGLTIAAAKTVTNNGNWTEPTGGTLTCAGSATFAGILGMNFYIFSATVASSVIIFQDGKTYKVLNNLTLTGTDENEIHLRTAAGAQATLSNTGGAQAVTYVKVEDVEATALHPITASDSWDINRGQAGALTHWVFDPMLFTYQTSGNWDVAANWFEGVLPAVTDNIIVSAGVNLALNGPRTINNVEVTGTITVATDDFTVNGILDNNGTMTISSGTVDVEGAYDATGGTNTFTAGGHLELAGAVTSVGTLTAADHGTVTYNGAGAQNIPAGGNPQTYVNLVVGGGGGIKSLQGGVICSGALTVENLVTLAMGAHTLTVAGASTITGTLDVAGSTLTVAGASVVGGTITVDAGTVDANGTFTAAGGNVTFTGDGDLLLSGVVASLGTLTGSTHGTVTYDGAGAQNIPAGADPQTYVNLIVGGAADQTKTLLGDVIVSGDFTIDASVTTAMGTKNLTVAGATDINGTVTISSGTLDANGAFDAAGAGNATGGIITFTDAGNLELSGAVTSLGALTAVDHGTVTYDGAGAQSIVSDVYVNLIAGGAAGQTKTLAGNVTASGAFTTDALVTTAIGGNELDVAGATDINGTVTIAAGTLDANGTFDATGGNVTFTAGGNLELEGAVTSLGTLTHTLGTVTYNKGAGDQDIFADTYFELIVDNAGTKELTGAVIVNEDLTIEAGVTLDVTTGDHPINIKRHFENKGAFTSEDGTITFDGDDDQGFTPGASTYYNIIFATTGAATKKLIINDGPLNANPLVMTNDLTVTTGTFDLGSYDSAFSIAGDLLISNGARWAKGGLVTFNGGLTGQTFTDSNIPPVANLGDITVD